MSKYRRIEVHAYHRRVTVVSGALRPEELFESPAALDNYKVLLDEADADESVEIDSPEGQRILAEAVRTLNQRLTPQTHATIRFAREAHGPNPSTRRSPILNLLSLYQSIWPKALRFARKEK